MRGPLIKRVDIRRLERDGGSQRSSIFIFVKLRGLFWHRKDGKYDEIEKAEAKF